MTYVDPLGLKKIKTNNFFFKKLSGSEELWSELGLPSDVTGEFHRYEDFSKFGSIYDQHTLQQLAYTDNLGFRRIIIEGLEEPAYMAALGSYYTDYNSKGVVFRVERIVMQNIY